MHSIGSLEPFQRFRRLATSTRFGANRLLSVERRLARVLMVAISRALALRVNASGQTTGHARTLNDGEERVRQRPQGD